MVRPKRWSDALGEDAKVTRTRGRGWGPFTGRQLTVIVCVAIVAAIGSRPRLSHRSGRSRARQ
jgi:hypothetical protein